jgi:carboxymethylenebutenolidase
MILLGAVALAQPAKEKTGAPSDDGREPHTLSKMLTPKPSAKLAAAVRGETTFQPETSYGPAAMLQSETNFQPSGPVAAKKSTPQVKAAALDKTLDGVRVRGYLVRPAKNKPRGAVLMIHEWWGLTPLIKKQADQLADHGFKVLAIDLYGGEVAKNRREASDLMNQAEPAKTLARLKTALTLLAQPEAKDEKPLKVGVIGWGFGAAQALKLAAADPRPAAIVVYYGEVLKDPAQIAKISSPLLGFFAERDAWITPKKVQTFKTALLKTNPDVKIHSFELSPGFALDPKDVGEQAYADTAAGLTLTYLDRRLAP